MTPLNLILWALAIGGAWLILSFCGLISKWIECRLNSLTLERKSDVPAEPDHRNGSGGRSNGVAEVSPDGGRGSKHTSDGD